MAEQEQIPHAPENPVADAIIPAAPPAEAAPAADNVPANAENLEVFLVSVSSVPFFRTRYIPVLHVFALFRSCLPALFVSFFFSPRSSLVVCYFTFYFVLGLFLLCFCCCFVRSPKGFFALLVSYWPYFV